MTLQGTMLSRIEGWAKSNGGDDAHSRSQSGRNLGDVRPGPSTGPDVRRVGKGLVALGLQPEDCVAIVGANRRDWVICQHGINAAQGIPAPLYTTLLPEQMAYIIGNAQSKIVICDDQTQLDKYRSIAKGESTIEHIVTMDDLGSTDPRVITLAALMEKGDSVDDAELDARLGAVQMDDVAHPDLHVGHDGTAQGGHAHAPRDRAHQQRRRRTCFPSLLENRQRESVSYSAAVPCGRAGSDQFLRRS